VLNKNKSWMQAVAAAATATATTAGAAAGAATTAAAAGALPQMCIINSISMKCPKFITK
jgi:hypothetical protein